MTRPSHKYRRNLGAMPAEWRDVPYRGYLICRTLTGEYWVRKDNTRICGAVDVDDAKRQINELLD